MTQNSQWTMTSVFVFSLFLLSASMLAADDYLSDYQDVTTRVYEDAELGFRVTYPYEWDPSRNPVEESDFYVGTSFGMPSFSVDVRPISADSTLTDSIKTLSFDRFTHHEGIEPKPRQFANVDAIELEIQWMTTDAGRHFVSTRIISFYANEQWYLLTVNQAARDTHWTPRLQAVLDSFQLLDVGR